MISHRTAEERDACNLYVLQKTVDGLMGQPSSKVSPTPAPAQPDAMNALGVRLPIPLILV